MDVSLNPDLQAKLDQLARETGRATGELVEDAVAGYFQELAQTRQVLDLRFDELEGGQVEPIDGEEAFRMLMQRTERQRQRLRPA